MKSLVVNVALALVWFNNRKLLSPSSLNDQDFPTSDTFKTTQNYSTVSWSGTSLPIREDNEGAVIVLKTAIYQRPLNWYRCICG